MANINYPYRFQGGKRAVASQVNANFDEVKAYSNNLNSEILAIQQAIGKLEEKPTREMFDVYYSFKAETPTGAYPLWTGETITNCKILYPDFWKELNRLAGNKMVPTVDSSSAFDDMVEEYGQCPCFYIDSLNGHVRLPKITRFISSISSLSDFGKVYNDQVSSHNHKVGKVPVLDSSRPEATLFHRDGPLVRVSGTVDTETSGGEGYPKHGRLCLYLQVVNNTAELSKLDVDALKKELETYITRLEEDYNRYLAGLQAEFNSIKGSIATAAKTYKYTNVQVEVDKFVSDETYPDYPLKADVDVLEASSDMIATVVFAVADAESGNYAPVNETSDGIVTIYAKEAPEAPLVIPTILVQ